MHLLVKWRAVARFLPIVINLKRNFYYPPEPYLERE